ncbi:MAG: BREX system Lon protease-like protein BrxL [Promethearchaeota archaeon]
MQRDNLGTHVLDDLDRKIIEKFRRDSVRKDYSINIPALNKLPRYIAEFLISSYSDDDGLLTEDVIEKITDELKKYYPDKREKELFKSTAIELKQVEIIGHFKVRADLGKSNYVTRISSLDEKAKVDRSLVSPKGGYPDLLKGGLWGKATLKHAHTGDSYNLRMIKFENYQAFKPTLRRYIKKRQDFDTSEWIDVLIKTIGLDPSSPRLNQRKKLLYLARLIPLVEPCVNIIEMGPPGTGKSHVFENLSFYCRVILGGDITPAKFIYNESTNENGLIFHNDIICFDEINKPQPRFKDLVPRLQQIMASNKVEKGDLDTKTDISLVFQGNIDFKQGPNGNPIPIDDMPFKKIPKRMQDPSFLDRIHGYIHGWELPTISDELLNTRIGLISNYFGEILHKLRDENFIPLIEDKISFFRIINNDEKRGVSIRDSIALKRLLSGYLKLLFPHCRLNPDLIKKEEWEELAQLVVILRQNVLVEIKKFDENFNRKLSFEIIEKPDLGSLADQETLTEMPVNEGAFKASENEIAPAQTDDASLSLAPKKKTLGVMNDPLKKIDGTIYITTDCHLIQKIPYWIFVILVDKNQIKVDGNRILIVNPDAAKGTHSLTFSRLKQAPMQMDPNAKEPAIDLNSHDKFSKRISKLLKEMIVLIDECYENTMKISIIKARLMAENQEDIALIRDIEMREKKILEFSRYEYITDMKKERDVLKSACESIALSLGSSSNLLEFQNLNVVLDSQEIFNDLKKIKDNLSKMKSQLELEIPIIEDLIKDKIKREEKREVLFDGSKFDLFIFDMNNLHNSYKKKYEDKQKKMLIANLLEKELSDKIKNLVLPRPGVDYIAYFFASKTYQNYQRWFPKSKHNKWYIEATIKRLKADKSPHYVDVDVSLTLNTTSFIEHYHDQIETFTLCSGDKDFYSLINLAKKYGIRVNVCAVADTFLAKKLERLADDTILLT